MEGSNGWGPQVTPLMLPCHPTQVPRLPAVGQVAASQPRLASRVEGGQVTSRSLLPILLPAKWSQQVDENRKGSPFGFQEGGGLPNPPKAEQSHQQVISVWL